MASTVVLATTMGNSDCPKAAISSRLNTSLTFFCESNGIPLRSCLWGRTLNGRHATGVVDDTVVQAGGSTKTHGVSYLGHELQRGKCAIKIESMTEGHFGTWSCILIGRNGDVFNGQVKVLKGRWNSKLTIPPLSLFFPSPWALETGC